MSEDFLSLDEVSKKYHLSKSFLYKRTSSREIPFYRVGKLIFFKATEFNEWFEGNCRVEAV